MIESDPEDTVFRSLAAPGLEEDDIFVAMSGLPVPWPSWGDGWLDTALRVDRPWDEEAERRRRHEELLERWRAEEDAECP